LTEISPEVIGRRVERRLLVSTSLSLLDHRISRDRVESIIDGRKVHHGPLISSQEHERSCERVALMLVGTDRLEDQDAPLTPCACHILRLPRMDDREQVRSRDNFVNHLVMRVVELTWLEIDFVVLSLNQPHGQLLSLQLVSL